MKRIFSETLGSYVILDEPVRPGSFKPVKDPALDFQIGGDHYKGKRIQPVEYIHANNLNYIEGCIVKYITRWRDKNKFEDLNKIKHYVDLLIAMENKYGEGTIK